jgi:leucine-rich repeat-containing G protein-coupled receptor 6
MPCQDLFDWWSLRCGVWIVFLMALLGNGAVVFVLIFARSKIDVPRFLVCNLGMADFFMGIYLGFLAVVDASTLGEFRMYAIPWQLSAGCQVSFGAKHIRNRNFLFLSDICINEEVHVWRQQVPLGHTIF